MWIIIINRTQNKRSELYREVINELHSKFIITFTITSFIFFIWRPDESISLFLSFIWTSTIGLTQVLIWSISALITLACCQEEETGKGIFISSLNSYINNQLTRTLNCKRAKQNDEWTFKLIWLKNDKLFCPGNLFEGDIILDENVKQYYKEKGSDSRDKRSGDSSNYIWNYKTTDNINKGSIIYTVPYIDADMGESQLYYLILIEVSTITIINS